MSLTYESADNTNDGVTQVNPYYTVLINFNGDGGSGFIKARTPDSVSMMFASQWAPVLSDKIGFSLMDLGFGSFGTSPNNLYATAQYWVGTKPLYFDLDLDFVMVNSAYADVVAPIKTLAKLVLPSVGSFGFLSPPGPRLTANSVANIANGGNGVGGTFISIMIGSFFLLQNAIVTYVADTVKLQFDSAGQPVRATVRAGFSSFYVATADSIDQWFLGGGGGGGAPAVG